MYGGMITLACFVILCLSRGQAQETTPEATDNIPYGGNCKYTSQCLYMVGILCKYSAESAEGTCECGEYQKLSEDGRECLKDIGASCTSHAECTLQYKYQDERTCGATQVCECTGNGDCGDGHTHAPPDYGVDFATDPADRQSSRVPPVTVPTTRPGIINAPPRTPTTVGPAIRTAGVGGGLGKSGSSYTVGSILLLLLSTVITKLYNSI